MVDLSIFKPLHQLSLSPSPSRENDIPQQTDFITFNCAGLLGSPFQNVMAMFTELSNQINELEGKLEQERQERISEQQNLKAQLTTLQPIARRILADVYLSIKGYRPASSGSRVNWITLNMGSLLPPCTGTTAPAFELKLASYCKDGDTCAHSTQTLAIALAVDVLVPPDEDLQYMFFECFGHDTEDESNGKITSTLVEVGKDGLANFTKTPSLVP